MIAGDAMLDIVVAPAGSGSPVFLTSTGEVVGIVLEGQEGRTATIPIAAQVCFGYKDDGSGTVYVVSARMENVRIWTGWAHEWAQSARI